MQTDERLWRTADGGLVRDGDEAGQSLAYAPGDEVAARDEHLVLGGDTAKSAVKPEAKMAAKPPNKQAVKPADK